MEQQSIAVHMHTIDWVAAADDALPYEAEALRKVQVAAFQKSKEFEELKKQTKSTEDPWRSSPEGIGEDKIKAPVFSRFFAFVKELYRKCDNEDEFEAFMVKNFNGLPKLDDGQSIYTCQDGAPMGEFFSQLESWVLRVPRSNPTRTMESCKRLTPYDLLGFRMAFGAEALEQGPNAMAKVYDRGLPSRDTMCHQE